MRKPSAPYSAYSGLKLNYSPSGEVQRSFMRSDALVRGIMGPVGSGKTTCCIMELIRKSLSLRPCLDGIKRSRWAVIRASYPALKTTTIKSFHQWFPPNIKDATYYTQGPPPTQIIYLDGAEIELIFLSISDDADMQKLKSLELTGAYINEAKETAYLVLQELLGRVGRYPSKLMGGGGWSGIIMDTNPPDTDHWWYKLAVDSTPADYAFFRQPSGLSAEAENLEFLKDDYYKLLSDNNSAEWAKVNVHGEFGFLAEGRAVFENYRDEFHCVDFEADIKLPIDLGIDFGLTPAVCFGQRDKSGRWSIIDELVGDGWGTQSLAEHLKSKLARDYPDFKLGHITGDPAGDQRQVGDVDERTVFQLLKVNGIHADRATTNDPLKRIEVVNYPLDRMIDGRPAFRVSSKCGKLRKALNGGYYYGKGMQKDRPVKNDSSHIADALQYMLLGGGEMKRILRRDTGSFKNQVIEKINSHFNISFYG